MGAQESERFITTIPSLLLMGLILLVFAFVFNTTVTRYEDALTGKAEDLATRTAMLTYLRAPIVMSGETMTVAELMARSAATENYDALHADVPAFLATLPVKPQRAWRYRLLWKGTEIDTIATHDIISTTDEYGQQVASYDWASLGETELSIPSYDPTHPLTVRFTLECQGEGCRG